MCSSPAPPEPQAPPPPTPVRDAKIDASRERQVASRRSSMSGYPATMLTGPGGLEGEASTTSPTLGN